MTTFKPAFDPRQTRRAFLGRASMGLGSVALASLLKPDLLGIQPGLSGFPNGPAKVKRVIFLCMAGGPAHLELLDYKPELAKRSGEPMPESFTKGQQIAQLQGKELRILGPQHPFKHYGRSGQHMTSLLPQIGSIADDICIVRSMQTEQINHDTAHTFMNSGFRLPGRPSMGSWLLYGLGSESEDLPGFVVLTSEGGSQSQPIAARQWNSGFLPSIYQGVKFNSTGDPVNYVRNPAGVSREMQGGLIDAVSELNTVQQGWTRDPEIATRIAQYELAFRMQMSVPDLVDFSNEPQHILDMYGTQGGDGTFNANCLLARRMAERGVRFIHLYHRGWDHHNEIKTLLPKSCGYVDQGTAALVKDLKQRGMFDDTLIVWCGEFGRTPMSQGSNPDLIGRDHHIKGFSMWMAGGGIKGGHSYGATDELGYNAVENVVHVHDLHATMLHLFGIDHTKLTYRFQGRDFRLTDVHGRIVKDILT
ncbi:MAG: DUF1501 domain-containing protein [Bryobacterales bacterium]|nr:DUF1501 domain-containing protein [Bryobacterales bacterium]